MAHYKRALVDAFKPHFKEQGFTKKDATWHFRTPSAIHVFNIQASQWSERYYFNAGIFFSELGPLDSPAEPHCHLRARIPDHKFHGASLRRACELSDFEGIQYGAEERIADLKNLIYPLALDWFSRFRDVDHTKRELTGMGRPWFAVSKTVWPLVGLGVPP